MTIQPDHAAERIARVEAQLAETKRKLLETPASDRASRRALFAGLDDMLNELLGGTSPQTSSTPTR